MGRSVRVEFKAESGQFEKAIANAQRSIQGFVNKNMTLDGVLAGVTGTIGKLAGGVGLAMGGVEAFNRVIAGSQTTSDEWDRIMRSANTTVNEFFSAISTGDFTAFSTGLDMLISKAREAQMALDQLGNTTISYRYFTSRNTAKFQQQLAILKDQEATEEQRKAAQQKMLEILSDQKDITTQFGAASADAVAKLVVEGNRLDASMITQDDIDNVLKQDVRLAGDEQKKEWAKQYDEYRKQVAEITNRNTKWETVGYGLSARPVRQVDTEAINKELAPLNKQYLQAITYNEVLVKHSDDWLNKLAEIQQSAWSADEAFASMQRTYERATKGTSSKSGTTKGAKVSASSSDQWQQPELVTDEKDYQVTKGYYEGMKSEEKYRNAEPVVTEMKFVEGSHQYDTPLGEKAMAYLQGGEIPIVKVDMQIDENIEEIDDPLAEMNKRLKEGQERAKKLQENMESTADAFFAAGSAASAFGNDSLAGVFNSMGAIAELIPKFQALATAEAVEGAAKVPWPGNIPAMFTALASVVSIFAQIKNFAEGGPIIPGTDFQDGIVARVSSGEMVMNQADQKRLYNSIHSGRGLGAGSGSRTVINGEQIITVANNYGKRTGRGEIVFQRG